MCTVCACLPLYIAAFLGMGGGVQGVKTDEREENRNTVMYKKTEKSLIELENDPKI